jgi:hypothetical protein
MQNNSADRSKISEADARWAASEVTKIESLAAFVEQVGSLTSRPGQADSYWFRGQSNREWDLKPSFLRTTGELGLLPRDAIELEAEAQREFLSRAHLYVDAKLLELAQVLQTHHFARIHLRAVR